MEWKRYYFKLEMEQLPERIWTQFKSSEIVQEMKMQSKSEIIESIDQLPEAILDKMRHTVEMVWREFDKQLMVTNPGKFANAILSESSLAKDWLSPEEDEAWKDL